MPLQEIKTTLRPCEDEGKIRMIVEEVYQEPGRAYQHVHVLFDSNVYLSGLSVYLEYVKEMTLERFAPSV